MHAAYSINNKEKPEWSENVDMTDFIFDENDEIVLETDDFILEPEEWSAERVMEDLNVSLYWYLYFIPWILLTLVLIFQLVAKCSDPGIQKRDESIDFVELLEKVEFESLCAQCRIIQAPRAKHCDLCNACVDRYDHHCGWIDHCIGRNNFKRFHAFIISLYAYIIITSV